MKKCGVETEKQLSFYCCDFCKACGASNLTEMTIQMISITRQYFPCIRLFWKLDFAQF